PQRDQPGIQGAVCGLPDQPDAGSSITAVPAVHDYPGVLESHGPDLVRLASNEGDQAVLTWPYIPQHIYVVEVAYDRFRDRRAQSRHYGWGSGQQRVQPISEQVHFGV